MSNIKIKIIAISKLKGMGKKRVTDFLEGMYARTGSYDFEYQDLVNSNISTINKLIQNEELTPIIWKEFCEKASELIEKSLEKGIHTIGITDEMYPSELKVLKKKPLILYAKGKIELLKDKKKIAIIGTRNPSLAATKATSAITEFYSKLNYTVVSGLAIGCDSLAHEMASITNGKTIALLAHGLDMPVYPKVNRTLAEDILKNGGLLVSEYPIGTALRPNFLVERDEWQSGMSLGTIAMESGLSGGTRHASYKSLEQNRVLAVFDHTQFKNQESQYYVDPLDTRIALNQLLIKEKKAIPLYTKKSFIFFDEQMKKIKEAIEKEVSKKNQKVFEITDEFQQNSFFD